MAISEVRLQELARMMAARVQEIHPNKPTHLRLVHPAPAEAPAAIDDITRSAMRARIRDLQRMFSLGWLVRQETFHVPGIECLEDEELSRLLRDMEYARECLRDGVAFEDAGLLRSRAD